MAVIALGTGVEGLRAPLEQNGFRVVGLAGSRAEDVDAVVVSGTEADFLGYQDRFVGVPVINASGKTSEDIISALQERLGT